MLVAPDGLTGVLAGRWVDGAQPVQTAPAELTVDGGGRDVDLDQGQLAGDPVRSPLLLTADLLDEVGGLLKLRAQAANEPVHAIFKQRDEQVVFIFKIEIDRAICDACGVDYKSIMVEKSVVTAA